jgi:enoyl-CoA hydratase
MTLESIRFQKKDHVAWLTLNRPTEGNAIDSRLASEIGDMCQAINQDDNVRVTILSGVGDIFCSGLDFRTLQSPELDEPALASLSATASGALASLNCPAIAAINGNAYGAGLELALACDIRIAVDHARLGLPDTAYGLIPGGGGTQRLPRLVGRGKATEMLLTAEPIDAEEAYRCGLVWKVVLGKGLEQEAESLANILASRAPIAVRYAKEAINKGMDMTLDQGLRLEADLSFLLQSTEDRDEGIKAFIEKRKGQFTGK